MRERSRRLVRTAALAIVFLTFILRAAPANQPATYGEIIDKRYGETSQKPDENQMTAEQLRQLDLENAIKAQTRLMAQPPQPTKASSLSSVEKSKTRSTVAFSVVLGLAMVSAFYLVNRMLDAQERAAAKVFESRLKQVESDTSLDVFFTELRNGLGTVERQERSTAPVQAEDKKSAAIDALLQSAPSQFTAIRALISEIVRSNGAAKKKILALIDQVVILKENSKIPALHPIYLMACGMEGLANQLSRKNSEFNVSPWRTIGMAADVAEALCVKRLNPELALDPPVRILAVDDDPISRRAVSFALEKVFRSPALAEDGEKGLALATKDTYDIIFLDVDMPGMDGFELCTKIHETAANRTTPVVFVTQHSDFNSRTKSALIGGHDLIGKPFLSFEITVKALSLVLRNRLQKGAVVSSNLPAIVPVASADSPSTRATAEPAPAEAPRKIEEAGKQDARLSIFGPPTPKATNGTSNSTSSEAAEGSPAESDQLNGSRTLSPVPKHLPDSFSAWSPVYLETLRNQLQAIMLCTAQQHREDLVAGLYLAVHSFTMESERARLPAIHRLSSALESMLKKVMEKPKFCMPSVWNTARAALDVLSQLPCRAVGNPDFSKPPPQILIVDDDPVARRAVCGAIQLVFGRPQEADNGEAAVAMASEKPFDLILLDILMPGIDGFKTCSKIRKTEFNQRTPVIFISNHDDAESREKAAMSGGSGFVPKPVFSSQITLTALTSILRGRLEYVRPDTIVEAQKELAACEA